MPARSQRPTDIPVAEPKPASVATVAQERPTDVRPRPQGTIAYPAWETSVGWGMLNEDSASVPLGWNASVAANLTPWLSTVVEVGGHYQSLNDDTGIPGFNVSRNKQTYMSGVRFSGRIGGGRVNPFGQVLADFMYRRVDVQSPFVGNSQTTMSEFPFAIQPGGGVDIKLSESIALRMQVDVQTVFADGEASRTFRFAPGIVVRSGRKGL